MGQESRRILYLNFANMGACVICLFKHFQNASRWGDGGGSTLKLYYGQVLSQHYIIIN